MILKYATPLGWTGIVCGLIAMIYTFYQDVIWGRYEGWINLGWKSDLGIALGVVAIFVGVNLIITGARRCAG
ncbi:MAG: hypothetical protein QF666_07500 [Alphaproteobacteria bacterium]|jgi:hypothetical protein|nr:hypothetical protein [Alphaproteobacteria bacterium]MDP6589274.1 hypothetical protein [Alphaproteobacteria bacterium]